MCRKPIIEIDRVIIIDKHSRIIREMLVKDGPVRIVNVSVKREGAFRPVTFSNSDLLQKVQTVEQIVIAVGFLRNIRCKQGMGIIPVVGVIRSVVAYSVKAPVRQVIDRTRVDRIVSGTELVPVCNVMGAVKIEPVAEYVWFPVRDISVKW